MKRLTTEEFIEKARVVHGDRYGYERTVYVTNKKKVTVTCLGHGDFEQRPTDHLRGIGCAKCSGKHRPTTEEFIEKARAVHGSRYGYDRAVYVNGKEKITITCSEHGDFEQRAKGHLSGYGCARCGGTGRLTAEEFIEKARAVHGSRYGYERTVYVRAVDKVTITCPEHGDFEQRPNCHLQGKGCTKCSGNHRPTVEEFIEKARAVHGDRYDYGRSVYSSNKKKITITCPEHGDFLQTPEHHLKGQGCAKCGGTSGLTTKEFIEKARAIHGSRYGYERAVYVLTRDKATITCPEHGDFEQTPSYHLQGGGCAKCSGNYRPTTEEFIEKARLIHGSRYGYGRTVYVRASDKVVITCPVHGDFEQVPNTHLQGSGCAKCSVSGFNSDKRAYLYILLDTETHSRVKIGISNQPDTRLRDLKRETPFTLERHDLFETPPTETLRIESLCHSQLTSANLTGFDGATEWFKFDGAKLEALRAFIRSCGGVQV